MRRRDAALPVTRGFTRPGASSAARVSVMEGRTKMPLVTVKVRASETAGHISGAGSSVARGIVNIATDLAPLKLTAPTGNSALLKSTVPPENSAWPSRPCGRRTWRR
jgi:hypothetical protein